jgi:hypothetical protein
MPRTLLLACAALACCAPPGKPADTLSPEQFAELHRLIKPQPGESKWAALAWLTNLDHARRKAVARDRPILLWRAGGGDVLGRT